MADTIPVDETAETPEAPARRSPLRRVLRWLAGIALALLALVVLAIGFLHTPPGRQFIVDQISGFAPASGLSVEVGEIDGSVLWSSTLRDVRLRDANDVLFLEVPLIDLNWRPLRFLWSGLDVRHLVLTDATLYAVPELLPGDPDAPMLPNFDIRIDRFVIDDLTVAEGLIGEERVIDFAAEADIRDGLVHLDAGGEFGGGDVFEMLVDAEPDGDRFDLALDWQAPAGGFLAAMAGASEDMAIQLDGDGTWSAWSGTLDAVHGGRPLLDFDVANAAGQYSLAGRAWPAPYVEGMTADALGEVVAVNARGTLVDSVLDGEFAMRARGFNAEGEGAVDLANNAFEGLAIDAQLLDETLFSPDFALTGASVEAVLNGPFRDLSVPHTLRVAQLDASGTVVRDLVQQGTLTYDGSRFALPLEARVGRVISGNEIVDPRLVDGRVGGTLVFSGSELRSDNLAIAFRGLDARLGLSSNFDSGVTRLRGPVNARGLEFDGIGLVSARANIALAVGGNAPWSLDTVLDGRAHDISNATIANLAGEEIRFAGGLTLGGARPIVFETLEISSDKLEATLDGRVEEGATTLAGEGRHTEYGTFSFEAALSDDGPSATLVLANPLPAAGLRDVEVALAPNDDGFRIEASGGSTLGPFDGVVDLRLPEDGDPRIRVTRLDVAETRITGDLQLVEGGVAGDLRLARGGVDGTVELAVREGGQGFVADLAIDNAQFTGTTPIAIARGEVDAEGVFGAGGTSVSGNASLQGVTYGQLFLGRVAARAQLEDGVGRFDAALTGARGTRFDLQLTGESTGERIAVGVQGNYAGRSISMPRRAVLLAREGGGWELQRSQLSYGDGFVVASGQFGGPGPMEARLALSDMPLSLAGVVAGDLGLGGQVSGVVELGGGANGLPVGEARLMLDGLTRSSAVLTSQPLDIALVADLSEELAQMRAVMSDATGAEGRLQGRVSGMPATGGLGERLFAGDLRAGLRFDGSAAALWRLAAIDLLDLTGEAQVAADITGTLADPQIAGAISGDDLRVRSSLTGTDVSGVRARGRFTGSRLNLTSFSGTAPNGGRVSGSGFVDLAGMSGNRGPEIDIRIAARNAEILDLPTMGATVTGPLRIVSNGVGGTVAGRLDVSSARWRMGASEVLEELPTVAITEVNRPLDTAPIAADSSPWRFLIDADAPGGILVDGMGLDSEWRGNIRMRGTTSDPRIGGEVQIVPRQGFYDFAGVRFDITRGRISFDENVPIDPRVDLVAESDVNGISVAVNITGDASNPSITFTSTPALPEEELLAQMLFGGSVTDLSATDALQLGAALSSLRGGSGLGPINQLRNAIGVDRLRLIAADPALGRGASVALGKRIGNRFYAEIITDGAGYNATELEFRVTSWLSLLATVSTIGRNSAGAEYRRDY